MSRRPIAPGIVAVSAFLAVSLLVSPARSRCDEPAAAERIDFDKQIAPIFQAKCARCHGEKSRGGQLDMRTRAAMLKGGNSGPAYKPGNSKKSLLVDLIHFNEMPPKKAQPRVTPEEFELIKKWIDAEPVAAEK